MLLNKRVCPTNTTMGMYQLPPFDRIVKCWLALDSRTGIVYNVTPSAVGVIVYKVVGNRYIEKRVNLRVEHVKHSACRQEFLDRVQSNHAAHVKAKEAGGRSLIPTYINRSLNSILELQSEVPADWSVSTHCLGRHTPSHPTIMPRRQSHLFVMRPRSKIPSRCLSLYVVTTPLLILMHTCKYKPYCTGIGLRCLLSSSSRYMKSYQGRGLSTSNNKSNRIEFRA